MRILHVLFPLVWKKTYGNNISKLWMKNLDLPVNGANTTVQIMSQRRMRVISVVTVQNTEKKVVGCKWGPSFCSTVDECDILLTNIHFSGYLTPGADTTEGGVNTVITDRTLEREKHDKFSRFINSIRCKIARTGFETNLYPIAIAHGDPHGQCYWRNACTESVEQRQTQTLAVLASRRTGKTGEAPKWKTTCKRTRPLVMRGFKMWKGWKQHWHPTFVKPSGALRFFLFLSMKWM